VLNPIARGCCAAALAATVLGPATSADDDEEAERGVVTIQFENDLFSGSDQHFTHGTRFAYLSPEGQDWVENLARLVPIFDPGSKRRVSYALGQNIFTPEDITRRVPDPTDRPYAGWLYATVGLVSEKGDRLDNLALDVGVVGPASFADETQTRWHRAFGFTKPEGWDHQLENEPGVVLYYERKWRKGLELQIPELPLIADLPVISHLGLVDNLGVDVSPHIGGALGNVFTYGALGVTFRFGDDLPIDYGPPRIRPSLPGTDHFRPAANGGLGWYLFSGIEVRAVARNIFLDGNTFTGGPSVDKRPIVADFQFGLAITAGPARLAYTHVIRTEEFFGQNAPDQFGGLSLSVRF